MITSYDTLAIEIDLFSRIDWYYAILDEGIRIDFYKVYLISYLRT